MKKPSPAMLSATDDAGPDVLDQLPLPYIEIDARGIITRANRATLALHPAEQGELIGRTAWEFLPFDEGKPACEAFCSLMESGHEPPVGYSSLYDRSGQFRTYEVFGSLMHDACGRTTGMRMLGVDVTEERKAHQEAQRDRLWLERVIASLADAVIVTDPLGYIRMVNPAAEELTGWKAAELNNKVIDQVLPLVKVACAEETQPIFTMALEGYKKGILVLLDHERRELCVEIGSSPILNRESDSTEGVVTVLRRVERPS
jgi:PAS domain S-box-containing protein